jgi:hypothetical protein
VGQVVDLECSNLRKMHSVGLRFRENIPANKRFRDSNLTRERERERESRLEKLKT